MSSNQNTCKLDGCDLPVKSKGACRKHALRLWRTGSYHLKPKPAIQLAKECFRCKELKPRAEYGHSTQTRDGKQGVCLACFRAQRHDEYWSDPEVSRAKRRDHYERNKESVLANNAKSREKNREKVRESKAEYYQKKKLCPEWQKRQRKLREENKAVKARYDKQYRASTPDQQAAWSKAWAEKNKAKVKAIKHNYKARRRAQEASGVSSKELAAWAESQEKRCYWCSDKCANNYHVDHYTPLSRGGKHELENLVIACPPCNITKNAKDPYQFANERGRLF